ncbi:MAG: electron transfer flavoprotein subunit beta/FixA family protein [Desulfobacterales bacterium]|nr:electron transfer flavoprotein subunit beta/FixA family protein [Desulfobacterales bacterium]MBF0395412.1 electron transfer flavoprotein subunit beta/FixA family protein [Desulfobacterales bacterium]
MHIIVCIKSVIIKPEYSGSVRSSEFSELNPFDRQALEMAFLLKESLEKGTVTVISMGPKEISFAIYEAMAMGADRGVLVCDPSISGSDTLATSTILASAIKKLSPFDLVLFGTRTFDSDTGHVGPQTATLLDIPLITYAQKIKLSGGFANVERTMDGIKESFEVELPGAFTIHHMANIPRDIGLLGIKESFDEKLITVWNLNDLNLSQDSVGKRGSPTIVLSVKKVTKDRKCEFINGKPEEQVQKLIDKLIEKGLLV